MYVIAGASGHVGGAAASTLLSQGQPVKVIVRDAAKGDVWKAKGAEVAVGDLTDGAFLGKALTGAAAAFILLPPNYAAPDFFGWQCQTSDTIAAAVKQSGVPRVVMLSSVGADLESGTGPIKGLHYLEKALGTTGTALTRIRAGYFQENLASSIAPAKGMGIFPNFTPSADYPMPMIATKDIAALVVKSLLDPVEGGEIVDLQGPAYSIRQVAETLGTALGKTLQIVDIPQDQWVPTMVKAGLPPHVAEVYAEMYAGFASGRIAPHGQRLVHGETTLDEVIKGLV
jgi:uncharacterized protein YbjT (DUF2867 family)